MKMGRHWCYFLFMLWFTYLIVISVLLFARGFLLSKNIQRANTTCIPLSEVPCISDGDEDCSDYIKISHALTQSVDETSNICFPQKSRIVLVIIDALRYDFAVYDDSLKDPKPYQNKLPIINTLLKQYPEHSRLYRFMADPPTTTMQRIKALTTGSLPTFIDAGSNFATNEINEDNIIDQLSQFNLSTVLIGDDTWDGLYPNRFLRKYPYPSFDVWDLDTVDYGVNTHLDKEVKQKDWKLLIAHYLGVDHCGHRYGPTHPEMARKLTEMNTVIENILPTLDFNTTLFVIGDHGMTETGNHGGDAEDEVTSAFFIYSKQTLTSKFVQADTVRQVDIVPTMAAMFGVSIPFSNLGALILDALPLVNNSLIENWKFSFLYLWKNSKQILNYIEDYAQTSSETFNDQELREIREKFASLKNAVATIDSEEKFENFAKDCIDFQTNLREACEKVWIEFNSFSMTRGLLFLFLSIFFVYMIADGVPTNRLPEIFMSSFLTCSYTALMLAVGVSLILYYFQVVANLLSTIFFSTGLISQFMLVMLIIQNWELITVNWYHRSSKSRFLNLLCRLILVFYLGGLFSNSFVVEESSVLLFLIATVISISSLSLCWKEIKKKLNKFRWPMLFVSFAILFLLRCSVYFWRCRDRLEQPWCYETYNAFSAKTETTKLQWILTVITLALFVTLVKVWIRSCGNLNGYSITILLLKYAPTVLVVCTSGFWVLHRFSGKNKASQWQANGLAWAVYGLSLIGITAIVVKPLCVYVIPKGTEVSPESPNTVTQIYHKIKRLFNEPHNEEVPILCGLGTAYSVVFIGIGMYLTHVFALIHDDSTAPSTVVMFLTAIFVLVITSVLRLETATSIEHLFDVPNISILTWVLLSQYFFYGTGHQPSFPNIIWDAAFVGTTGIRSNLIPGALIILNTFCSQILIGFLLPLHIMTPFTLSVMSPSIIGKNILEKENLRGELLLYERNNLMLTVAFTTSCKYMICHAIRIFVTMLAATIHCRHMMIWKIFAPKLIFESIGMFVVLVVVNVSYLMLIRINSKVNDLVITLNKKCS